MARAFEVLVGLALGLLAVADDYYPVLGAVLKPVPTGLTLLLLCHDGLLNRRSAARNWGGSWPSDD